VTLIYSRQVFLYDPSLEPTKLPDSSLTESVEGIGSTGINRIRSGAWDEVDPKAWTGSRRF